MYIWELFGFKKNYNFKLKEKYDFDTFKEKCDNVLNLGTSETTKEYGINKIAYKLPNGLYITLFLTTNGTAPGNKGSIQVENTITTGDDIKRQLAQGALSGATGGITDIFSFFKPDMREAIKILKEKKQLLETSL